MKKRAGRVLAVILSFMITVSLSACTGGIGGTNSGQGGNEQGGTESTMPAGGTDGLSLVQPARWANSDLKETYKNQPNVLYKDDFNMAVNREWVMNNEIPDGYSAYEMFTERQMEVDQLLLEILQGSSEADTPEAQHDLTLVQSYYRLWLDWDHRNELGITPLKELMAPLQEVETLDELTEYLGDLNTAGNATELAAFNAECDWNNTDLYTVYVTPMSFVFGDSSYYQGPGSFDVHDEPYYDNEIRYLLVRMGYSDEEAGSIIEGCVKFESMVADHVMTTEERNAEDAVQRQNNPTTMAEMKELAGAFPIEKIAGAFNADNAPSYVLTEPEWLRNMDLFYKEENLEIIKDYLLCYTAQDYATLLDREAYEHYNEVLNGISGGSGILSDEKAASNAVDKFLPMQLGRVYTDRYVSQETIDEVTGVIDEVLTEYESILSKADYLSDATRAEAVKKLATMRVKVAKPTEWEDDSALMISGGEEGGNLFLAQKEISKYLLDRQRAKIGQPFNHETWDSSPQDVNAFYSPMSNSISICAGILGGDFYSNEMTREQVLATVGDTIAHEISHAFDSSGCHFDEKGNLRDWWTEDDFKAFRQRADRVVEYYNDIEPMQGLSCSGSLVEAEAIADLGAMKAILRIAKRENDFDYKTFFETYASTWRCISTEHTEMYLIMQDSHPLAYLRTNVVVQQFQEFYDTYEVKPGDGMYVIPSSRLEVW